MDLQRCIDVRLGNLDVQATGFTMNQFTVNQLDQEGTLQLLALNPGQRLVLLQALLEFGEKIGLADFLIVDDDQR